MRNAIVYQDQDGLWIIEIPSLPVTCGSEGSTREEALENTKAAIRLWIENSVEAGESIPDDYPLNGENLANWV